MILLCTFATRKDNPDIVELIAAWDEFSADAYYEGFLQNREGALKALGDDLLRWCTAEIDVDMKKIYDVLTNDPETSGSVRVISDSGGPLTNPNVGP